MEKLREMTLTTHQALLLLPILELDPRCRGVLAALLRTGTGREGLGFCNVPS